MRGDLVAHAELIEEPEAAFDVSIRRCQVARGVGEQALDPFHAAADETVAALLGVVRADSAAACAAVEIAGRRAGRGLHGAGLAGAEVVVVVDERRDGGLDQAGQLGSIDRDAGEGLSREGQTALRAGVRRPPSSSPICIADRHGLRWRRSASRAPARRPRTASGRSAEVGEQSAPREHLRQRRRWRRPPRPGRPRPTGGHLGPGRGTTTAGSARR